ncbi:hypothetical protein ACIPRD_30195 [Streptomyces sp. NPDC090108]|uniref:hypothetical protein n=1 Tax=Streptomyces sp. NPDC090108 TaxID=3365947 RepID=UPI0037FCD701
MNHGPDEKGPEGPGPDRDRTEQGPEKLSSGPEERDRGSDGRPSDREDTAPAQGASSDGAADPASDTADEASASGESASAESAPGESAPDGSAPGGSASGREKSVSGREEAPSAQGESGSDGDKPASGLDAFVSGRGQSPSAGGEFASGRDRLFAELGGFGPDLGGPGGTGPGGFDPDEEPDLRRLLHSAVDGMEPRDGTLDHLRRAVPARRARKRQALVGMAAAALFFGTAIPALIHVSNSGTLDPNTAMAGQSSDARSGTGKGKSHSGDSGGVTDSHGKPPAHGKSGDKHEKPGRSGGTGDSSPGATDPSATASVNAPLCTTAQLSVTGTSDASMGSQTYAAFRVSNISGTACTVSGGVTVTAAAQGAADPSKLASARHVSGDAATGLPDPSLEAATLVLQPGDAYEEKAAFVPSETCPVIGGGSSSTGGGGDTGVPSPDPTASQDASATGTTDAGGAAAAPTTQLVAADGMADGSVLITFTGETGTPTSSVTVPNACAGTVYFTGVLPSGNGA